MADIAATATLDITQFSKGLQQALAESKRWRSQVQKDLAFDPFQRLNFALRELKGNLQGAKGLKISIETAAAEQGLKRTATAAKGTTRELTDIEQAVIKYRNATLALNNEIEGEVLTREEGIRVAKQYRREIAAILATAERGTKGHRDLAVALGRTSRTVKSLSGELTTLGLSQQVALGTSRNLTQSYQQLAGALTAVFATAGLTRYIRTLVDFSGEAAVARNTISLFYTQVGKSGLSLDTGTRALALLAEQFQTTEDAVASGLTQLVRYGASLEQAVHILQRGGASALAAGKTAANGFENVTQAIIGEMSASLNRIGIAGNLSTAYRKYAQDIGKTTEALTNQDKITALINITLRETDTEYEALGQTLAGFVGAQNRASTALAEFRRAAGRGAESFLAPLFNAVTRILNAFNALPPVVQTAVTGTTLLLGTVAGLAVAYATLRAVLVRAQVVQTAVTTLVNRETVARSKLGSMLLVLAGRYRLLTREQVVATARMRDSVRGVTLWGTAMTGLRAGFDIVIKGLHNITRASLRFLATPIGVALAAIAGAFLLIKTAVDRNKAVVKPALDAIAESTASLQRAVTRVSESFQRFLEQTGIAAAFKDAMVLLAREVSLGMARLSLAMDRAAISMQFLQDLVSEGPQAAWGKFNTAIQTATARFDFLVNQIHVTTAGVRDGTIATGEWGDALVDTGDDADAAAAELKKLQDQAIATAKTFQERLKDIRIGLMPEGEARDIAATREEFMRLRQSIRDAAEENVEFKPFEARFLADAFELEQLEIERIQADYADRRVKAAEEQAKELADAVREGERRIVDEQTRDQLNAVQGLRLAYQRRIEDTQEMYATLMARAREHGQDTTRLEELLAAELLAVHQGYERDVRQVYDDIYATISDRQRDLVRAITEARGDERGLLGIDFDDELRDMADFYAKARREAVGNAALLAALDAQENAERTQARQRYWDAILAQSAEMGDALVERERDIAKQQAEAAGDRVQLARLSTAGELREINARYDELEKAAAGNAADLARIAELRNQELALADARLAKDLKDLSDEAQTESFAPLIEGFTDGLDEATRETTRGIEAQLRSWRVAYAGNSEIVKLVDAALTAVEDRYGALAEETTKSIEKVVEASRELSEAVSADEAARGLSEVEQVMAKAAARAADIREQQERNNALLVEAVGAEREALIAATMDLDNALASIARTTAEDAERITVEALKAYQDGMEKAALDASQAAAQLVERDVQRVIAGIADVQTNALAEARTNLLRQVASLRASGLEEAALQPLKDQMRELDEVLRRQARSTADFADEQFQHLRDVAEAVLDQAGAQRVANQTYVETIRLRRLALEEARREATSVDELSTATQNLTGAQLAYLSSLDAQASNLRALRGEYAGVYGAVSDLATLLDRPVPEAVIDSQRDLALASLEGVRAAQEAGQSFSEYGDQLQDATRSWQEYETASTAAIQAQARVIRDAFTDGRITELDEGQFRRLANRMVDAFGITFADASSRIRRFIDGALADPLEDLEFDTPDVISDIFTNLNDEAVKTPEAIEAIDAQIASLADQVETLKAEIAGAVNFDAAGEQLVSGYEAVIERVQAVTGETFADAGTQAVEAFTTRLREEQERLQDELESTIGTAATAAGLTAGEGLMTAFASGIRSNQGTLLNAVDEVLRQVRDRLPSSDAKKGPLSDLTYSGKALIRTFVQGAQAERSRLAANMDRLLQVARPNASLAGFSAAGASGGPVTVNVDGRTSTAPGPLALDARRLVSQAKREAKIQGLFGRKP